MDVKKAGIEKANTEKANMEKANTEKANIEKANMEKMRLNKYLASCGVCSRREADRLIEKGFVTVNGQPGEAGQGISPADVVEVRGERVSAAEEKVVLAYHKPAGVTCSERDDHADKLITDMIDYPARLTYAGRLDKESTGLMIMTNDGNLINAMMKGSHRHEKEYIVKVRRDVTAQFLADMASGVYLEDLHIKTRKCKVKKLSIDTFSIILTQGVNRQIKRMCKACGNSAASIKRVRVMNIELGNLAENEWREVTGEEKRRLYELSGQQRTSK